VKFPFKFERKPELREVALVAGLVALATVILWSSAVGRWTEQVSYDVLAVLLREPAPRDTIIVYMDERSQKELNQKDDRPWDRNLHARLLDYLTKEGARLVYFDVLFEQASSDPAADLALAEAMRRAGNVILGGSIAGAQDAESTQQSVIAPLKPLRLAAKAWGGLSFFPIGSDYGVRQVPIKIEETEHASLKAARLLRDGVEPRNGAGAWMQYSGPPNTFPAVGYHQVLQADGVPAGLFKNKVVIVGAKFTAGFSGSAKDAFVTPYSRFGFGQMPGTEVNANLIATLRADRAMRKMGAIPELLVQILAGGALAWVLLGLRPASAGVLAIATAILSGALAWFLGAEFLWWGNWFLFAGLVVPLAGFGTVARNYYIERAQRQRVIRAFEKYLSPEMVRQAAMSKVDLKPGGSTRRITAMMTDIKGFSTVAEKMTPAELSGMLVAYFTELTRHIFDYKGTILQFAGDGSYSVWGAPLEHPEPADQAVRAALALQAAMREGKLSETRVGISTGTGLCGNLGSYDRFDYTVIGDNTNLASRLEGANKKLGTHVLLADSTKRELRRPWVLREVGDFLVAGRDTPVKLWEPIAEGTEPPPEWRATLEWFARGLAAWRAGDQTEAARCFKEASESRGEDGDRPAQFYLARMGTQFRRAGEVAAGGAISLSKE
jgi:adenylate cyclase